MLFSASREDEGTILTLTLRMGLLSSQERIRFHVWHNYVDGGTLASGVLFFVRMTLEVVGTSRRKFRNNELTVEK